MTGTAGEIKQKSESNRPREPCGRGLATPGPFRSLSQSHFISETSCPLSPEFTSAALAGQDVFIIRRVTWKWLIDHQSIKGKARRAQKAEVAPLSLITIAPVALFGSTKAALGFN